jgi:hypothetical protein
MNMFAWLPNGIGYICATGLTPIKIDTALESKLRQLGVYDRDFGTFQSGIGSVAQDVFEGLPLPPNIGKDWLLEQAITSSTQYLKKRPNLMRSLVKARLDVGRAPPFSPLKTLFEDCRGLLREAEKKDLDLMLSSDMPASFFNDSMLAYRSISSFLDVEYHRVCNGVNKVFMRCRGNRPKLGRAMNDLKESFEPEMSLYRQLVVHHGKLRLYVSAWNAKDAPATMLHETRLHFDVLDKTQYAELSRLFKMNLFLFNRKFLPPIREEADNLTETMWRELIEPLPAQ